MNTVVVMMIMMIMIMMINLSAHVRSSCLKASASKKGGFSPGLYL